MRLALAVRASCARRASVFEMELKTLILVIGGLLILAVLGHGFYLTWRARRDELRMDLEPVGSSEPYDEMDLLRAELPTGGARVRAQPPSQGRLDLDGREPLLMDRSDSSSAPALAPQEPVISPATNSVAANDAAVESADNSTTTPRSRVTDVDLADQPISASDEGRGGSDGVRQRRPAAKQTRIERPSREPAADEEVTELIVINVICRDGKLLPGDKLVEIFLASGLKFGEMNIYHNKDPLTRATRYSVANAVEPGTFDLSAMDTMQTPGVTFFMRMPGGEPALEVFEHMLRTAQDVARRLGGELRDEQHSVMTPQTIAHCRTRITEFYRKRLSRRAV